MPATIESLREILELDPTSKLFFPLAKLLHEEGEDAEARGLLRQGLVHHPEHLEASLYLIEVLDELGEAEAAMNAAEDAARVLADAPAFWRCWSKRLEEDPEQRELSFAVQFVAARLAEEPVSWAEVLSRGLRSLKDESCEPRPKPAARTRPAPTRRPSPPARPARCAPAESGRDLDFELIHESERSEVFSLRTRTMADLLARQGDLDGAVEIYRELLSSTPSGPMRDELEGLIETTLRKKGERKAAPPAPEKSKEATVAKKSRKKLLNTLESLAERLEARAAE